MGMIFYNMISKQRASQFTKRSVTLIEKGTTQLVKMAKDSE